MKIEQGDPCEYCGGHLWYMTSTLIRCANCGVLYGRCEGLWRLDPDSIPMPAQWWYVRDVYDQVDVVCVRAVSPKKAARRWQCLQRRAGWWRFDELSNVLMTSGHGVYHIRPANIVEGSGG